jgi:hypothetical protein
MQYPSRMPFILLFKRKRYQLTTRRYSQWCGWLLLLLTSSLNLFPSHNDFISTHSCIPACVCGYVCCVNVWLFPYLCLNVQSWTSSYPHASHVHPSPSSSSHNESPVHWTQHIPSSFNYSWSSKMSRHVFLMDRTVVARGDFAVIELECRALVSCTQFKKWYIY